MFIRNLIIMKFIYPYRYIIVLALIILVVAFLLSRNTNGTDETNTATSTPPTVSVATPSELSANEQIRLIGTVQAATEGDITAQNGGRIARVAVADGDNVSIGTILVELDNQQERNAVAQAQASLRQAQAGLPAAGASAANRAVAIREAEAGLVTAKDAATATLQTAFSNTRQVVTTTIDPLFSSPEQGVPGARIGTGGTVQSLNEQRRSLRTTLPAWQNLSQQTHNTIDNYKVAIATSNTYLSGVTQLLDTLITAVANQRTDQSFSAAEQRSLESDLRSARDQLVSIRRNLDAARDGLQSANEALERAQIANIDTDQEQAIANVAQAEAALQSAQIALSETILRAPVSGTVTDFSANIGAVIAGGTKLGRVIGGDTNEIEVFLSQRERQSIQVGSTVTVGDGDSGTVTRIAPSIDQETRKIRAVIATDSAGLAVGTSVPVQIQLQSSDTSGVVRIPLTAVQFRGGQAFVLIVNDESRLETLPITIAETRGSFVVVDEGIDADTTIVTDTRGRRAGTKVTISE